MKTHQPALPPVFLASAAFATLFVFGCSGKPEPEYAMVSGQVHYHAKPVVQGTITMYAEGGYFGTASIDDGQYRMARAPVGSVRVVVTGRTDKPDPKEQEQKKWADIRKGAERIKKLQAEGKSADDVPPEPLQDDPKSIPAKYGGDRTTPLVREVKPGRQEIDIDIEKD
jgi:hypothetical protein